MPAATPIVGTAAKVKWTSPAGGTEKTIKNMNWKLSAIPDIKRRSNTTDGFVRVAGLNDYEATVEGDTDTSDVIEGDIVEGSVGTLKLYRDGTKFFSMVAICTRADISTGSEDVEHYNLAFALQSGSLTLPV